MKKFIGTMFLLLIVGCQTQEDMIKSCVNFCGSRNNVNGIFGDYYGFLSCDCKDGSHFTK